MFARDLLIFPNHKQECEIGELPLSDSIYFLEASRVFVLDSSGYLEVKYLRFNVLFSLLALSLQCLRIYSDKPF